MNERKIVPQEVLLGKIIIRTAEEIVEGEGLPIYNMTDAKVYNLTTMRNLKRGEPFTPNDAA
jgi:hypothetical protein